MGSIVESGIIRPDPDCEYLTAEGCFILEMSNSEADEALSVARARVPPGETTRLHKLLDTTERYVILAGRGQVQIGDATPEEVEPGDVVLIPAGVDQRISNTDPTDLVFLALCTPRFRPENYIDTQ